MRNFGGKSEDTVPSMSYSKLGGEDIWSRQASYSSELQDSDSPRGYIFFLPSSLRPLTKTPVLKTVAGSYLYNILN